MIKFFTKEVKVYDSLSDIVQRFSRRVELFNGEAILVVYDSEYKELYKSWHTTMLNQFHSGSMKNYYGIKIMSRTDYDFEIAVRAEAKKRLEGK